MSDELLSLDVVAAKLKVSREQVRRLCSSGRLPFVNVGTGKSRQLRRIHSATLEAFMQDERRAAVVSEVRNVRQTLAAMAGVEEYY